MSTDTPTSLYLLRKGSNASVSYLHFGTGRCALRGRRSTRCLYPPEFLGSSLLAETHCVGPFTALTAPSLSILGSSSCYQNSSSSVLHYGLRWWNGGGDWRSGSWTPLLIHYNKRGEAPVFAQNFKWLRTTSCRPWGLQAPLGAVWKSGNHPVEWNPNLSSAAVTKASDFYALRQCLAYRKIRFALTLCAIASTRSCYNLYLE
jgi:hypothetical protein